MGSIVLKNDDKNKDDNFIVVDGQQRLTTMTIYAISTISVLEELIEKNIDKENNQQRILEIERSFIGKKTISTLFYETKLTLNKNNNIYFQDYIVKRREPISYPKLKDSEKALYDCYSYFKKEISEKFLQNGEKMTDFLENIVAKKMIFRSFTRLRNFLFSFFTISMSRKRSLKSDIRIYVSSVTKKTIPNIMNNSVFFWS
jgi:uncharacterized protein with ParB-like and HNH nuclease domain